MPASFEITHVAGLLNTSPLRLNKLANMCRIKPSIGPGGKRGKRRHFSVHDVCRLGLALWLWKAGLRGPAVSDALRRKASRSLLAGLKTLKNIRSEAQRERYVVAAHFRGVHNGGFQRVALVASLRQAQSALQEVSGAVVPVGKLLESLAERLESFASF